MIPTFKRLCRALPASEIPGLIGSLEKCVNEIKAELPNTPLVNPRLVHELYLRSKYLLEQYSDFPASKQALIIGVVYYFALDEDPTPDSHFATGLDDDVHVMNYVLEELEIEGMDIEI